MVNMGKRFLFSVFVCFVALFFTRTQVHAFQLTTDPQYVVMNFSEINELNWAAPEDEWQTKIKPIILKQLDEFQRALPRGTTQRKLAWSTLEEYMNTPMDTPSQASVYAIKMRRILDIAEETNLPVFLPLNGFQWWDELPELYNWWDPDGTHTPDSFFARQRTPDFKQRFIAGYNPDNIWNVEWSSPTIPMKLNWRNWGSGGFRLAPPPNLAQSPRSNTHRAYRSVLDARFTILMQTLADRLKKWEQEGKHELFAGITIGTEISLNASATPADEFQPYGFRSTQDLACPPNKPSCFSSTPPTKTQMSALRQHAIEKYFQDLMTIAQKQGIPKQRIYTHVWSEAMPNDKRYENYAAAAFSLYARPGMSFYGYAEDPWALPVWNTSAKQNGFPLWGAVEYSAPKTLEVWRRGIANTLDAEHPAKLLVIYNWTEHKDTPAMQALTEALTREPTQPACTIPELINPRITQEQALTWQILPADWQARFSPSLTLHVQRGLIAQKSATDSVTLAIDPTVTTTSIPPLKPGVYSWYVDLRGCGNTVQRTSQPQRYVQELHLPPERIPWWVRIYFTLFEKQFAPTE